MKKQYIFTPTAALFFILILFACGGSRNKLMAKLLNEQKVLKDSANSINERSGCYMQNNSAEANKKQLATVYGRLIDIQFSIDSLEKVK